MREAVVGLVFLGLWIGASHAAAPSLIHYQGRVAANGVPLNGPAYFKFAFVNGDGTATYWSNDGTGAAGAEPSAAVTVPVKRGLYSVLLGDSELANMIEIPGAVFNNSDVRLRVWFGTSATGPFELLSPDQRIASVGYAMVAEEARTAQVALAAQTAETAQVAQRAETARVAQTVSENPVFSGRVGIGTETASEALEVNGTVKASRFEGDGSGLGNVAGTFRWEVVTGNSQQAGSNRGYVLTSSAATEVTLPSAPAVGDTVRLTGAGAGGWRIRQNDGQLIRTANIMGNMGPAIFTRESERQWQGIASSADGSKLAAVASFGKIYTSSDSGVTWMAREQDRPWHAIACSADGVKLVAVVWGGQIYTSTDSGMSWTARASVQTWSSVASSADGVRLIAADANGKRVFTSIDSGVNWGVVLSGGNWIAVASSADGRRLVAVEYPGRIWTWTDSGASWTARESTRWWNSVASSADGTKLIAAEYGGRLYTSLDSGVSWIARESDRAWTSVASSADGTKLAAVEFGGKIYLSRDSGVTWIATGENRAWQGIASSADGQKFAAVVFGGQIYTISPNFVGPTTTPGPSGGLAGGINSTIELQFIGNGHFLPLSFSGSITSF